MIVQHDIAEAVSRLGPVWPKLAGARIFFTGGTGFIGRWMLEILALAPVAAEVLVLSRDPARYRQAAPHLARRFPSIAGEIGAFEFPDGAFTHIIHGATEASAALTATDPRKMFETIVNGTRRTLDFALHCGAKRVLNMSSGAVYGVQPPHLSHVDETWLGGPDSRDPKSAYAEGKRAAETLCAIYDQQFRQDVVSARIFALLGPMLPLATHFAAGNFIRDAAAGRRIQIQSGGQAVRSYLYAADLAVWLWTILADAPRGAVYNCGSEEAVSIADLACRTAAVLGGPGVDVLDRADTGWNPGRYVPSTAAIRRDLGVTARTPLDEAIRRTALAYGWNEQCLPKTQTA